MTKGYTEFEFDLPEALLSKLIEVFKEVDIERLVPDAVGKIPEQQGVYQLFLESEGQLQLVYIGKTDAKAGLRIRLSRHAQKIQHRLNLDPSKIFFKAVRIFVFTAVDLETQLIEYYQKNSKIIWNKSGFGSNDPGQRRDTTTYKPDHFDSLYPIDLDRPLDFELPRTASVAEILKILKDRLPYLIRFERQEGGGRSNHPDFENAMVSIDQTMPLNPANVIRSVIRSLPPGWHATMLPSHVILYKDDLRIFPSGTLIAKSP